MKRSTFTLMLALAAMSAAATGAMGQAALSNDFESYEIGQNAAGWYDTAARNSMSESDGLFAVLDASGQAALGTKSTSTNIHSHYVDAATSNWCGYTYSGRLRATDGKAGIGVTFLSDYPNSDAYYRLRTSASSTFHISPHPYNVVKVTSGTSDSGVSYAANKWYRFVIEVTDEGDQTHILAKIWQEGQSEPGDWQIDCYDANSNRLTCGTVGVWGNSSGTKYWDDLEVTLAGDDGGDPTGPTSVVKANRTAGAAPMLVKFDGRDSHDPDGKVVSYAWDFGNGYFGWGPVLSHMYTEPGTYEAKLAVKDDSGNVAMSEVVVITVTNGDGSPTNQPPVADLTTSTTQGEAPLTVNFDASGSHDADGQIASYSWNLGGTTTTAATASKTYDQAGSYQVTVTVTDDSGDSASASVRITVTEPATQPVPNEAPYAGFSADATTGGAPLIVNFDGSDSSDDDGQIVSYLWDFGDGSTGTGVTANHEFAAGTYDVTLTVKDDDGATATSDVITIVVDEPATDPGTDPGDADYPLSPPAGMLVFTGNMGSKGFDPVKNQLKSWWFYNANCNGNGADATIFAIGTDCAIINCDVYGGKHGIRIASVNGLHVKDCWIKSSGIKGSGIKLCGIGNLGPASRNILIEDCDIIGRVAIKPQNSTNALMEKIENITLRNVTIKPYGNTGVRIAAKNVRCENVTIDFRDAPVGEPMGFVVTDYYGCKPSNVTITNDCKILTNSSQRGVLISADIPITRE